MPVKAYVSRDVEGRPWLPDARHEVMAAREIVKSLYATFNHLETLYAVVANLRQPNADMVIVTERGLGVVELKHYAGHIWIDPSSGRWYAGKSLIQSGSFPDPHVQVQVYAENIRKDLLLLLPIEVREKDDQSMIQTAICFTHPDSLVDEIQGAAQRRYRPGTGLLAPWEQFSVLTPKEVPTWTTELRFGEKWGGRHRDRPYRLSAEQIETIVGEWLNATEWTEIANLMPTTQPYGYLILIEGDERPLVFGLDRDEMLIGRDPKTCDIVIPARYTAVSREKHACLTRTLEGVFIQDVGSRYGTYINGERVQKRQLTGPAQQITLGGGDASDRAVCLLQFQKESPALTPTMSGGAGPDTRPPRR